MPITPTSTKSKNYQALGIDEIANDIETVFTAVNDLETEVNNLPAAPTTTVVNISSAQILSMGSNPVELLPAAGVGKYYDISHFILEYTHVSMVYDNSNFQQFEIVGDRENQYFVYNNVSSDIILNSENRWFRYPTSPDSTSPSFSLNGEVSIGTNTGLNPTLGDGTLRVIITYTLRTFGA